MFERTEPFPELWDSLFGSFGWFYVYRFNFRELFPRLSSDGIFEIDGVIARNGGNFGITESGTWFHRDEQDATWLPFALFDSRVLEVSSFSRK